MLTLSGLVAPFDEQTSHMRDSYTSDRYKHSKYSYGLLDCQVDSRTFRFVHNFSVPNVNNMVT